jgi:hypothetical protein
MILYLLLHHTYSIATLMQAGYKNLYAHDETMIHRLVFYQDFVYLRSRLIFKEVYLCLLHN